MNLGTVIKCCPLCGVVYGNVLENPKAIKFYFEKVSDTNATD